MSATLSCNLLLPRYFSSSDRAAAAFILATGLLSSLLRWTDIFSYGIRKHSNYILDLSSCRGMSDRKHLWSRKMREIIDLKKFPEKD